jgi:hypothetical protein
LLIWKMGMIALSPFARLWDTGFKQKLPQTLLPLASSHAELSSSLRAETGNGCARFLPVAAQRWACLAGPTTTPECSGLARQELKEGGRTHPAQCKPWLLPI